VLFRSIAAAKKRNAELKELGEEVIALIASKNITFAEYERIRREITVGYFKKEERHLPSCGSVNANSLEQLLKVANKIFWAFDFSKKFRVVLEHDPDKVDIDFEFFYE